MPKLWRKRVLALLLCLALLCCLAPRAAAAEPRPYLIEARLPGLTAQIHAYQDAYENNVYLSMHDLSAILNGTAAQFRIQNGAITRGQPFAGNVLAVENAAGPTLSYLSLARHPLSIDGRELRYYSYAYGQDLYLSLIDVQLLLNVSIRLLSPEALELDPETPFAPTLAELRASGYFDCLGGIYLADLTTDALIFAKDAVRAVPIASLSKLMSYLLLAEAMDEGSICLDDKVLISQKAAALSWGADGTISLSPGAEIPLQELLEAMLIASSNEAALALAEHLCGSESAFVERMNARAAELELRSAVFYTPHGLPTYVGAAAPAKLQNAMSARDMYRLIRYLLETQPEITEITSKKYTTLPTLKFTTANSNPLLFNLEGVTGLKTGSTNKAGFCVTVTLLVEAADGEHTLVLVLTGAETADVRGQAAELLLRYAQRLFEEDET